MLMAEILHQLIGSLSHYLPGFIPGNSITNKNKSKFKKYLKASPSDLSIFSLQLGPWAVIHKGCASQWPNLQYKGHENHSGSTWHRVLCGCFLVGADVLGTSADPFNQKAMMSSLVGGFNPSENYSSNWKSSLSTGENKNMWNHHLVAVEETSISFKIQNFERIQVWQWQCSSE